MFGTVTSLSWHGCLLACLLDEEEEDGKKGSALFASHTNDKGQQQQNCKAEFAGGKTSSYTWREEETLLMLLLLFVESNQSAGIWRYWCEECIWRRLVCVVMGVVARTTNNCQSVGTLLPHDDDDDDVMVGWQRTTTGLLGLLPPKNCASFFCIPRHLLGRFPAVSCHHFVYN